MSLPNVDSPMGFSLYREGGKVSPVRKPRNVLAARTNPLFVGDAYTLDANGNAVLAIGSEGSADKVRGIVEAIQVNPIAASPNGPVSQDYIPAADAGGIIGIEDPDAEFEVQMTTFATTDLGSTFDHTNAVAGSTLLRQSRQKLDQASGGAGKNFLLVELANSPADNVAGAFARVVVRMLNTL